MWDIGGGTVSITSRYTAAAAHLLSTPTTSPRGVIGIEFPMDPKLKTILNVIVVIAVVLWLLKTFGVLGSAAQRPGGSKLSW